MFINKKTLDMAQKKSTAKKATAEPKATVTKTVTQGPTEASKEPVVEASKPKPAPKATQPAPAVTQSGIYQIKTEFGASNLKAMPLPGKRVLLILPNSSTVVNDLEIVSKGNSFILR